MGDDNFHPPSPRNPHHLTDHQKLVHVIMSATPTDVPNFVQICPWGLLGKWVNYNEASRLHSGEVMMDNITFLWFLRVFLSVPLEQWINCSF